MQSLLISLKSLGCIGMMSLQNYYSLLRSLNLLKQVGNGISRRYILGSKIAKGHESVKNSKYQTHKKSIKLKKIPKRRNWCAKRGNLPHFLTSIVAKIKKLKGDPLVNKNPKKVSQCQKK